MPSKLIHPSAAHLLPALNIIWAIIAFCQSTVTKSWHLYICRVITGFLEASSFGGTHLISQFPPITSHSLANKLQSARGSRMKKSLSVQAYGSWATRVSQPRYTPWQTPQLTRTVGSMFSGYLQAAIYQNLNGVGGRAGWQWLFIVQGIITLPVAFIGFVTWPGLPASPKRWFFTEDEYQRASTRIRVVEKEGITWSTFKYTLGRPMWWICVPCYV